MQTFCESESQQIGSSVPQVDGPIPVRATQYNYSHKGMVTSPTP